MATAMVVVDELPTDAVLTVSLGWEVIEGDWLINVGGVEVGGFTTPVEDDNAVVVAIIVVVTEVAVVLEYSIVQ